MKKIRGIFSIIICLIFITGCSDASVVNENLTKDADNFKVYRHIVFITLLESIF